MKVNLLQIGDWVKISHLNKIGKVYRIDRANGEGNGYAAVIDGDYHEWNLEPIPLTPEILEKNGFVKNHGVTSWKFETDREDLIDIYGFNDYHLSINIKDTHGSGKGFRWMLNNLTIFYVHQLQHVLRICGIEKEIIL